MPSKPVMNKQCKSCIFRHDGNQVRLSSERMAEISSYLVKGTQHICHTPQAGSKDNLICRGGRDFQLQVFHRLGVIAEPTDESLSEAMQAVGMDRSQLNHPGGCDTNTGSK